MDMSVATWSTTWERKIFARVRAQPLILRWKKLLQSYSRWQRSSRMRLMIRLSHCALNTTSSAWWIGLIECSSHVRRSRLGSKHDIRWRVFSQTARFMTSGINLVHRCRSLFSIRSSRGICRVKMVHASLFSLHHRSPAHEVVAPASALPSKASSPQKRPIKVITCKNNLLDRAQLAKYTTMQARLSRYWNAPIQSSNCLWGVFHHLKKSLVR